MIIKSCHHAGRGDDAGSGGHGNIPDYAVVGGNPATVIKYRDIERFKQLKAEKKFR